MLTLQVEVFADATYIWHAKLNSKTAVPFMSDALAEKRDQQAQCGGGLIYLVLAVYAVYTIYNRYTDVVRHTLDRRRQTTT